MFCFSDLHATSNDLTSRSLDMERELYPTLYNLKCYFAELLFALGSSGILVPSPRLERIPYGLKM